LSATARRSRSSLSQGRGKEKGGKRAFAGFGLVSANWLSAALIFLPLLAATLYRIRVEEAALSEHFGEEYLAYTRDTKRLVPGLY